MTDEPRDAHDTDDEDDADEPSDHETDEPDDHDADEPSDHGAGDHETDEPDDHEDDSGNGDDADEPDDHDADDSGNGDDADEPDDHDADEPGDHDADEPGDHGAGDHGDGHDPGDSGNGDDAGDSIDLDAGESGVVSVREREAGESGMRDTDGSDDGYDADDLEDVHETLERIKGEIAKRIVGQRAVIDQVLACILCDGNALLESNPGLGKTLLVRTIADVTDLEFSRIQNTPDLMPSDIVGTEIIRETDSGQDFQFQRGPVFANIVLADEINRATPKTQSALLEAMQERQVTAAGETYALPRPFFLLATQNPIDQEGTYPLPEAQSDRFLLKVLVDFPSFDEERDIVSRYTADLDEEIPVERVVSSEELRELQRLTRQVPIADDLRDEAISIVQRTRTADEIEFGASPRASMGLVLTSKARALLAGRPHVSREDIEAMAPPVLRHRIILDFRAEREGKTPDEVVRDLL